MVNGQCLSECPFGFYENGNECPQCTHPCLGCINPTVCVNCRQGYYLDATATFNNCVQKCPDGTYGDLVSGKCEQCNSKCWSCAGPTSRDCTACYKGYSFISLLENTSKGRCIPPDCGNGYYLSKELNSKEVKCKPCYQTCKKCYGPTKGDCLECIDGLYPIPESMGTYSCYACEELDRSFYTKLRGVCAGIFSINFHNNISSKEKCGDGIYVGLLPCDDGNRKSGDGCNKNCQIEGGFKCEHRPNSPDVCYEITNPTWSAELKKKNVMIIKFDKNVITSLNSIFIHKMIC